MSKSTSAPLLPMQCYRAFILYQMEITIKGKVKLGELEAGKLFIYDGTIALKSEYRTEKGAVEAYIIGSGEMFWGGTSTAKDQVELEVIELGIVGF